MPARSFTPILAAAIALLVVVGFADRTFAKQPPFAVQNSLWTMSDAKFSLSVKSIGKGKALSVTRVAFAPAPGNVFVASVEIPELSTGFDMVGTYTQDEKGRLIVVLDQVALAEMVEDFLLEVLAEEAGGVDPGSTSVQIDKIKLKAKVKNSKKGPKLTFSLLVKSLLLGAQGGEAFALKSKLKVKGKVIGEPQVFLDTTPPAVVATLPADGARGVDANAPIVVTFDEALSPLSVNTNTFIVQPLPGPGPQVDGLVGYADAPTPQATFTPIAPLLGETTYTVTLTNGITDADGNALDAAPVSFSFTTADATPPQVLGHLPLDIQIEVPVNTKISVVFDQEINAATLDGSLFLFPTDTPAMRVDGVISYEGLPRLLATFDPTDDLAPNTNYTAVVTTGVEDLAGNPLLAETRWTFLTGGAEDTVPPLIFFFDPNLITGPTNVAVSTHQVIEFSEPMDRQSVEGAISITPVTTALDPADWILFFWNPASDQVTLVFDTALPAGIHGDDLLPADTEYSVVVQIGEGGAKDLAGNPLEPMPGSGGDWEWSFTTQVDVTPPEVETIVPDITAAAETFAAGSQLIFTFNEPVIPQSPLSVELEHPADSRFAAINDLSDPGLHVGWIGSELRVTFVDGLIPGSVYRLAVNNVWDNEINSLDEEFTIVTADTRVGNPSVMSVFPAAGATGVSVDSLVFIGFSRAMAPGLLSHISVTADSVPVDILAERSEEPRGVVLLPAGSWPASSTIDIEVDGAAIDASGQTLGSSFSYSFTTGPANTRSWSVDPAYSTLADGDTDIQQDVFGFSFVFRDSAGERVFPDARGLSSDDVTIIENATGIPLKGYRLEVSEDGELEIGQGSNDLVSLTRRKPDTAYSIVFNPSFTNSSGTAITPTPITFTTALVNDRPFLQAPPEIDDVNTTSEGLILELGWRLQDADLEPVTATAASNRVDPAAFQPVFTGPLFDLYYETPGDDESGLLPRSTVHTLTFTAEDDFGHVVSVKRDIFPWSIDDLPEITAPTGQTTGAPLYEYTLTQTARNEADFVFLFVESADGDVPLFTVLPVPPGNNGSFQHPADAPLAPGDYSVIAAVGKFETASTRGNPIGTAISDPVEFKVIP